MKNVISFVLDGGVCFAAAALISGVLYWAAPIVPCRIETTRYETLYGGYQMGHTDVREDWCSGEEAHGYSYGFTDIDPTRDARLVQAFPFLATCGAGAIGGMGPAAFVKALTRERSPARA